MWIGRLGRISRGIYGIPEVSLGPAMTYLAMPYERPPLKQPYRITTPLDTPCHNASGSTIGATFLRLTSCLYVTEQDGVEMGLEFLIHDPMHIRTVWGVQGGRRWSQATPETAVRPFQG
jgi:hypothetical protein